MRRLPNHTNFKHQDKQRGCFFLNIAVDIYLISKLRKKTFKNKSNELKLYWIHRKCKSNTLRRVVDSQRECGQIKVCCTKLALQMFPKSTNVNQLIFPYVLEPPQINASSKSHGNFVGCLHTPEIIADTFTWHSWSGFVETSNSQCGCYIFSPQEETLFLFFFLLRSFFCSISLHVFCFSLFLFSPTWTHSQTATCTMIIIDFSSQLNSFYFFLFNLNRNRSLYICEALSPFISGNEVFHIIEILQNNTYIPYITRKLKNQ